MILNIWKEHGRKRKEKAHGLWGENMISSLRKKKWSQGGAKPGA